MEVDRIHIGLVKRVGIGAAVTLVAAVLLAASVSLPLAVGVALGGGFMLLLYGVYRVLAPVMLSAPARRRSRVLFWAVWALKWPLLAGLLYFSFRSGLASPLGVALGAGLLPAVAVLLVLRALLHDAWHGRQRRQAG